MRKGTTVHAKINIPDEQAICIKELIQGARVSKSISSTIQAGRILSNLKDKVGYGFGRWCKRKLYLSDQCLRQFISIYEHADDVRDCQTISEAMRIIEPDNPRYKITRKMKPRFRHKEDTWNIGGLILFYYAKKDDFPKELTTSFGTIPDVKRFYEDYITVLKSNNGNEAFRSYLNRLTEIRQLLTEG